MAERRNVNFWSKQVLGLGRFEPEWFKVMRNDLDFSCGGDMGNHVEKTIGNRLLLSGPLIDSYLEEIAKNIASKLSRSKLTGLVPPITFFIPWEVMSNFAGIFVAYGAEIKNVNKGKKNDKVVLFCEKLSSAKKIFSPSRFDGSNYLRKRFFTKSVDAVSKIKETIYSGCAEFVFSINTPLRIDYVYSTSKAIITFSVQRYDKDDFCVDASLQKIINESEAVPVERSFVEEDRKIEEKREEEE